MKKNKQENAQPTSVFKIKFSATIYALSVAIYLLCAVGIAISIWRIYNFGVRSFSDALKYPFLIAVCVFCILLVTAILIKSQYVITDKYFISQYGFIKSKFSIKDVTAITLDTDVKKLTVNFGEQFMVLSIDKKWNEELVRAMLAINPNIDYGFTLAENKPPIDEDNTK